MIKTVNNIDTSTEHGRMLLAALALITTTSRTDKTPYEVLEELNELKGLMFEHETKSKDDTVIEKVIDSEFYNHDTKICFFERLDRKRNAYQGLSESYIKAKVSIELEEGDVIELQNGMKLHVAETFLGSPKSYNFILVTNDRTEFVPKKYIEPKVIFKKL